MNKQHTLKRIVTFILTLIITVTGILFMPNVAHAAEWQQNNKGWRWQENDKTYATSEWKYINNHWYHFNEAGYMDTGWTRVNGSWYYYICRCFLGDRWSSILFHFNQDARKKVRQCKKCC